MTDDPSRGPNPSLGRRRFLRGTTAAGAGLVLGFGLPACDRRKEAAAPPEPTEPPAAAEPEATDAGTLVNGWLRIAPADTITLLVPEAEMGQGVHTAFAMIAADELRARWEQVRAEHAPLDPDRFGRQSTGGSTSIRQGFAPLRNVAAQAREMLVATAADRWGVDPGTCTVNEGVVTHGASGREARFGALAEAAGARPAPPSPTLLDRAALRLVGTSQPRLDTPAKTRGEATFGIDASVPGMRHASVARTPIFGGVLDRFDGTRAKAVPGVRDVLPIPQGVAVVADHTWAAMKGRDALEVTWKPGRHGGFDTASVEKHFRDIVDRGEDARRDGDPDAALSSAPASRRIDAEYVFPFLAHAPMEPLGCTAAVEGGSVALWVSTQSPTSAAAAAAEAAGVSVDDVVVHSQFLGGGFGRRSHPDFVAEAVAIAKKTGAPVKLTWTREDDIRGGFYRPGGLARLSGAIGADGLPTAWVHRIAAAPINSDQGVDRAAVSGARDLPYAIPHVAVTYARPDLPISTWYWRSVGHSQNGWMVESFIDELLALGGRDAVEGRLALLRDKPEHRRVLETAAEKAGWGTPPTAGRARGVAVCEGFGSFVAQVAEVSVEAGALRVHKVTTAIDCGEVVNPNTVDAQIASAITFGLGAALHQRIDFRDGRAVQSNFGDYPLLRLREMPELDTHLVPRGGPLGGVGEPGTPPVAPAVGNALRALTGAPVRTLPIRLDAPDPTAA